MTSARTSIASANDRSRQYRVKSAREPHQRVVKESELTKI